MKRFPRFLLLALLFIPFLTLQAQTGENEIPASNKSLLRAALKGWNLRLGAGFSIGGTSPLPLPAEIRHIDSYQPTLCIMLTGMAQKKITKRWGIMTGLRFEEKGMKTDARVKNYHMEAREDDGSDIIGAFTGHVKTKVSNKYLTFPLLATYTISPKWQVQAGPYFSYLISGEFSGEAYGNPVFDETTGEETGRDSYIRDQDPTGNKTEVSHATYEFSDKLRRFNWGLQVGGEFKAFRHLAVSLDLTWAFNGIFPYDFTSVTFDLYPIYGTLGFHYLF